MLNNKQRAYLRGMANSLNPVFQIGKGGATPSVTQALDQCLESKELIKVSVLNNCEQDIQFVAQCLSERTRSQVVQIIGHKIILYRESKNNKAIVLPK